MRILVVNDAIDKNFCWHFFIVWNAVTKIISISFGQSLQYSLILDTRSIVSSPVDVYASIKSSHFFSSWYNIRSGSIACSKTVMFNSFKNSTSLTNSRFFVSPIYNNFAPGTNIGTNSSKIAA